MNKAFDIAFNHVQKEQDPINLELKGHIPEWINGTFYRNGPGLLKTSNKLFKHWFDGLAMIHKFDIADGQVSYQSKYIQSKVRDFVFENDSMPFSEFATDPCISIFNKIRSSFSHSNPKVNIQLIDNHLIALGETRLQLEIDRDTMKVLGIHDYSKKTFSPTITTAHPHVIDNDLYNLVLSMGPMNFYKIVKYNLETKKTETICKIPIYKPAYIHSFGMSANYFIIAHYPYTSNTIDFIIKNKPFIENFKWRSNQQVKFIVISKKDGKIVHQIKTDPFFAFHFINAFEVDDTLVFDMVNYPDAGIIESFYLDNLSNLNEKLQESGIYRFRFDLHSKTLHKSNITNQTLELPRIDDRYLQKKYDHVYAVSVAEDGPQQFYDQLIKVNIDSGDVTIWKDSDYYPGEPIFIPNKNSKSDDEGILLSILINIKDGTKGSKLLFLDAKSFTEIASCQINHTILPGFHGCYTN